MKLDYIIANLTRTKTAVSNHHVELVLVEIENSAIDGHTWLSLVATEEFAIHLHHFVVWESLLLLLSS